MLQVESQYSIESVLEFSRKSSANMSSDRNRFELIWARNILFVYGRHWISVSRNGAGFVDTPIKDETIKVTANYYGATFNRIAAVLGQIEPNWEFVPTGSDIKSIASARYADKIESLICEEVGIESVRQSLASWVAATGNGFLEVDVHPTTGKLFTKAHGPFSVLLNPAIENFNDQQTVISLSLLDRKYAETAYNVKLDKAYRSDGTSSRYIEILPYLSHSFGYSGYGGEETDNVLVKTVRTKPCSEFEDGLHAVIIGDNVLSAQGLYKTDAGDYLFGMYHAKFDHVPGSAFGRTPLTDLCPVQVDINKLYSLAQLIVSRSGSPTTWVPEGVVIKTQGGKIDTSPGAVNQYSVLPGFSGEPRTVQGLPIPSSTIGLIKMKIEDIQYIASVFESLQGQQPYSGAPARLVDTLARHNMDRFGPTFRSIAEAYRLWMKEALELFRLFKGNQKITLSNRRMSGDWEVSQFNTSDFYGAGDVRIQSDSYVPRTRESELSKLDAIVGMGYVDVSNPLVKYELLKRHGFPELAETVHQDIVHAEQENDIISKISQETADEWLKQYTEARLANTKPPRSLIPVKRYVDNHAVHTVTHRIAAMKELSESKVAMYDQHIAEHADITLNAGVQPQPQPEPAKGSPGPVAEVDPGLVAPQGLSMGGDEGADEGDMEELDGDF